MFDGKVLIAGGRDCETDVELFDFTKNECVEMPPLSSPVSFMATVRRDDTMLLMGGMDGKNAISNEIIQYDYKTGKSDVLMLIKTKLAGCAALYLGNTLMTIGGAQDSAVGFQVKREYLAIVSRSFEDVSW